MTVIWMLLAALVWFTVTDLPVRFVLAGIFLFAALGRALRKHHERGGW